VLNEIERRAEQLSPIQSCDFAEHLLYLQKDNHVVGFPHNSFLRKVLRLLDDSRRVGELSIDEIRMVSYAVSENNIGELPYWKAVNEKVCEALQERGSISLNELIMFMKQFTSVDRLGKETKKLMAKRAH
jgi:hypothetical protein